MQKEELERILIQELADSPQGVKLTQAMSVFQRVQRKVLALATGEESTQQELLQIGTVFQIFLIDTLAKGKRPEEFSTQDWKDLAANVAEYGLLSDGKTYSKFVFDLYADYISISARSIALLVGDSQARAIDGLAQDIRHCSEALDEGKITEVYYIDQCLWLSLEAMVKLLSSYTSAAIGKAAGEEWGHLTQVMAQIAFEYGRASLFTREQEILDGYLRDQQVLDEYLEVQYENYLLQLQEASSQFRRLIENAFSPEIRNMLMDSATLARAAGVREEDVLTSLKDVDGFFLD